MSATPSVRDLSLTLIVPCTVEKHVNLVNTSIAPT